MKLASDATPPLAAISGGLGDIGIAMSRKLDVAGARVALGDLPAQVERGLPEEVAGNFRQTPYICELDVSEPAAVEAWFDAVEAHFQQVPNLIVVNAAVVTLKPLLALRPEEWTREIDVNLTGAYWVARAGAERLRRRNLPGRIVLVGSWAAHAPHAALPAYSVAKAGLRMLMQCLALELAPAGILVNELAPGYVDAGLSGRIYQDHPGLKTRARQNVPLGKLLDAEDVADQLLYLCSDWASHMTGSTLLVDGGLSLLQGPQNVHE